MSDSPPYPDFVNGPDQQTLDGAFTDLVRSLTNRSAQFLFGTGMSETAHVPNSTELLRELFVDYFPTDGSWPLSAQRIDELLLSFPFDSALEALVHLPGMTRDDLTRRLNEKVFSNSPKPSKAHEDFLSLFWGEKGTSRIAALLTTNFDNLLEQVVGEERAVRITKRNIKHLAREQQLGKIPVIHLLGVLDEEYQATESDSFSNDQPLLYELEVALHYYESFVFVGYSAVDSIFRQIYSRYRNRIQTRSELNKRTYIVSPVADFHSYAMSKSLWESRGLIWIPLDAGAFFAKLRHFMITRYDEHIRLRIMRKYSLAEPKSLDDYIHRTADLLRMTEADALQFLHEALPRGGGK